MNFPIKRTINTLLGLPVRGRDTQVFSKKAEKEVPADNFRVKKDPSKKEMITNMSKSSRAHGYFPDQNPIRSFKKGGMVHASGPAYLHKGEYVVPKDQVQKAHKNWRLSDGGAMKDQVIG